MKRVKSIHENKYIIPDNSPQHLTDSDIIGLYESVWLRT